MSDINQLARQRRQGLAVMRRNLKPVDSNVEVLERFLKRLQARKRTVPRAEEYATMGRMLGDIDTALSTLVRTWNSLAEIEFLGPTPRRRSSVPLAPPDIRPPA